MLVGLPRDAVFCGRSGSLLFLLLVVLEGHLVEGLFGPVAAGAQESGVGLGLVANVEVWSGQEDAAIGV